MRLKTIRGPAIRHKRGWKFIMMNIARVKPRSNAHRQRGPKVKRSRNPKYH